MPRRLRSVAAGRLLDALVALVVLVALGLWLGLRAFAAQGHLEQARGSLEVAGEALLDRDLAAAEVAIEAAGRDTARTRNLADRGLEGTSARAPHPRNPRASPPSGKARGAGRDKTVTGDQSADAA